MAFTGSPIQRKLMRVILLTSTAVLLLTCSAFFAYEFVTFRQTSVRELSTLGQIIAANSTAALAFDDTGAANEILAALKAEPHIVEACLYNAKGNLFSSYPTNLSVETLSVNPEQDEFTFEKSHLHGFQPVVQGTKRLGTLYLKSDMGAMYERFRLYGSITALVIVLSLLLAYLLSKNLQQRISTPILALAETAKAISDRQDYSVRAVKQDEDELGLLTDAFNHMLTRIQEQTTEIRSFNQKLEQMVTDRTHELKVANNELESFSYSISHDLRAPLRSIHGYMNIFAEEYGSKFDDEANRLVNIILKNGQKMGQLIDDLLAFSQLGRKELVKSEVVMNAIVESIVEEYQKLDIGRVLEISVLQLPIAHADNTTIRQVWVNLISNAVKYSKHKEKIIIEIGSLEKDDDLIYYVKDNGAGFDMKYYGKLFGVFQRLHSDSEFEGTGVGLAIVQRVIAKHGGKVWATAKVNEGATFFFSLNKL